MLVDLDNFKQVNHLHGSLFGDAALQEVGQRLENVLINHFPSSQWLHYSGDIFLIFIERAMSREDAVHIYTSINNSLSRPIDISGMQVELGSRLSIANAVAGSTTFDNLLDGAEFSLRLAKQDGDRFAMADNTIPTQFNSRSGFRKAFNSAVVSKALRFYFQPKYSLESGEVIGSEALVRWHDENEKPYPVSAVLESMDHYGMSNDFAIYTLDYVIDFLGEQIRLGSRQPVSINLDIKQLTNSSVISYFQTIAASKPEVVGMLEVEVTEDNLFERHRNSLRNLLLLRQAGYRLSIDDFGKGYSNLKRIIEIQPNTIKIDKVFVDSIVDCTVTRQVISAMVQMQLANGSGLIAEGVETEEQAEILRQIGVKSVQGFLYNPPLPRESYLKLISANSTELPA